MSFPQTPASKALNLGMKFFRLNQTMVCPGDMYESDVAGAAFAVGPESDIAQIQVNYYDPAISTTFMNSVLVTNHTPYVGTIFARNDATYEPAKVPGKILFSSADIVPQLPPYTGAIVSSTVTMIIPPVMDIVQYFSPLASSQVPARSDRNYFFSITPTTTHFVLMLPFYGRAFAQIQAFDAGGGGATMNILGVVYGANTLDNPQTTTLLTPTAISTGLNKVYNSKDTGYFDYLEIEINGGLNVAVPLRVRFSDFPQ